MAHRPLVLRVCVLSPGGVYDIPVFPDRASLCFSATSFFRRGGFVCVALLRAFFGVAVLRLPSSPSHPHPQVLSFRHFPTLRPAARLTTTLTLCTIIVMLVGLYMNVFTPFRSSSAAFVSVYAAANLCVNARKYLPFMSTPSFMAEGALLVFFFFRSSYSNLTPPTTNPIFFLPLVMYGG